MQIGEIAQKTGISRDTLRFYETRGLIRAHRRPNGYRHYPEGTLFVLDFIVTAKQLGFTLAEIEEELPSLAEGGLSEQRIADILESKIRTVDTRIADLKTLRTRLAGMRSRACPLATPV